jgi:hypothetical protein
MSAVDDLKRDARHSILQTSVVQSVAHEIIEVAAKVIVDRPVAVTVNAAAQELGYDAQELWHVLIIDAAQEEHLLLPGSDPDDQEANSIIAAAAMRIYETMGFERGAVEAATRKALLMVAQPVLLASIEQQTRND